MQNFNKLFLGVNNIKKLLAPLIIIGILLISTMGGVYAGDVNVNSSSTESPVSVGAVNAEPTYTLVYVIIGIVAISILFYSSYIKRDD